MTGKLSIILDLKKEQKARRRLDKQREKDLEDSEWEERLKSLETFAKGTKSGIMRGRNEKVVLRKEDGGKDDAGRVMNEEERRFLEKANKMSPLLKVKSVKITRHGRDVEEVEEDEQGEGDGGEEVNRWMSLTEDLD